MENQDEKPRDYGSLRVVAKNRADAQAERIRFGNRLGAVARGAAPARPGDAEYFEAMGELFALAEATATKRMRRLVRDHPMHEVLVQQRGVSDVLASRLLAEVDITRAPTVSSLWKYCGLAVRPDGRADRPVKGEKLSYNARARVAAMLIAESLLRCGNEAYAKEYYAAKAFYEEKRLDWAQDRRHRAALRKMVKLFLSHLWVVWREAAGLPTRVPYVLEYGGHTTYKSPQEYGWS